VKKSAYLYHASFHYKPLEGSGVGKLLVGFVNLFLSLMIGELPSALLYILFEPLSLEMVSSPFNLQICTIHTSTIKSLQGSGEAKLPVEYLFSFLSLMIGSFLLSTLLSNLLDPVSLEVLCSRFNLQICTIPTSTIKPLQGCGVGKLPVEFYFFILNFNDWSASFCLSSSGLCLTL
jgi:hypothetical protein